jgi:cytochrome c oxidase subunit II
VPWKRRLYCVALPFRGSDIIADHEGTYRGQCAEFCGYQHAHMSLIVVARGKSDFKQWREAQISAANAPADEESRKGQAVFLSKPCASCHTVRARPPAAASVPTSPI